MIFLGAHVSAAGGVFNAPLNAHAIGANAFALFTKNQKQWHAKPLTDAEITQFKANCETYHFVSEAILPHDSYLINLGNPDPEKAEQSYQAFLDEMRRCEALGLCYLNFHPGSHLNLMDEHACLAQIARLLNRAIAETEFVIPVIENTAGQGTNLGWRFEHIAEIIREISDTTRIGVCIDTCHTFSAGYDLATVEGCDETFAEFEKIIGFKYLRAMHLNDDMKAQFSRVDRHAPLGDGTLGWTPFEYIVNDARFQGIPLILETPDDTRWAAEIQHLRDLQK